MNMHIVVVTYHAMTNEIRFQTAETAQSVYEKIATALRDYKMFKNDRQETIEIETDDGKCTFRLDRMDTVTIGELDPEYKLERAALEREKAIREMRLELGLPETTCGVSRIPQESASE
jgi:hypothetical protein